MATINSGGYDTALSPSSANLRLDPGPPARIDVGAGLAGLRIDLRDIALVFSGRKKIDGQELSGK